MADVVEPNATPPATAAAPESATSTSPAAATQPTAATPTVVAPTPAATTQPAAAPTPAAAPAPAAAPRQVHANVANVIIRNRIPAGGVVGQNNLINIRERLFHEIYFKVALIYAQLFPPPVRRALEYFILFKAVVFFAALVYLHMAFIKNPATCLQHVKDWPRDGVLRVEVIPNLEQQRALIARSKSNEKLIMDLEKNFFYGIGPQTKENHILWRRYEYILREAGYELKKTYINNNQTKMFYVKSGMPSNGDLVKIPSSLLPLPPLQNVNGVDNADDGDFLFSILFKRSVFLMLLDTYGNADEQYVVEYSLEYGHLRLSGATRKRLHIPVRVVQLDPMKDKCFGDSFSKFMLRKVLGYDDLLMASVRIIAEQEDNKGYLRNVITGEHYRFVSMWWAAWSSYPTAFSVMLLFTFSISMLLRFSHHQIFVFIVDLLQMLEFNVTARFPIAPLLTVILALVGMEAIMSEFFNDATTAFYIILIVWVADQYDAICCHTTITKRHWLRFFYLYHFAFYAYHYRFSGQNRNLSLLTSWLFIQHSMVYFFHRYELPVIVQQAQIIILTRNQPNAAGGANANANAVNADAATGGATGEGTGAGAGAGQQQLRQRIFFFRQQQVRLPLLGIFPLRNRPLNWESIQRVFMQRGWRANLPVRVQIGNVHGINVRSMQQNAGRYAATATATATATSAANAQSTTENETVAATTSTSTTTTSNVDNSLVPNAADEVTATTGNVPPELAARSSSETNIKSNEKATTSPIPITTSPPPTPPLAATLSSSDGRDVKPCRSGQHQNTATGNNHVEQPETLQNNKIENKLAHEQWQKQENNDDNIISNDCYDAVLATATATRKQTNQDEPIITEAIKTPITTSNDEATLKNGLNKNEQLENDLYAIVDDDPQANTTESNQGPQQFETTSTRVEAAMAAMATEALQADQVQNELTANSADMLQAINQVNIENSGLSNGCNVVATTSTSATETTTAATATVATNENFDMIDSGKRRHLTQDGDKTFSNSFISTSEGNSSSIQQTSDKQQQQQQQRQFTTLVDDRERLCSNQNDFQRNLLSNIKSDSEEQQQQQQQNILENFIANEAAHSSKF